MYIFMCKCLMICDKRKFFIFWILRYWSLNIREYHTNKCVNVVVEANYDRKEDFSFIPKEDISWKGKFGYTQKKLASFPNNRERYTLDLKKKKREIAYITITVFKK